MNKSELVETVASNAGVDKRQAETVLSAFFETVTTQAKSGEKVAWPGFGSFSTTQRGARTGRNPRTGEPVKIKASTAMKFTPSSTLKETLNTKKAAAKKTAAKKTTGAAKSGASKATATKATAKKAPAKTAATSTAKKTTAKKAPAKKSR